MLLRSILLLAALGATPAAAELRLVMVEQPGCVWCAAWDHEIGPIYARSEEGRQAPLVRQQLRKPLPEGFVFSRPATFTPTFVLVDEGREIGRIEGYPGEGFFWALLGQMLDELPEG
ncbi:thioredoxin family protein [Rhodobacter sp. NSM]|uniref:thioredoxin family protein n=1 Tax=Rhodobacter sp. NSM TaxID=3457501 RepID=UPI003FD6561D